MTIIDFFIGLTLMNAMPHIVLGIWHGRILSGFGFGNSKNIAYGLLNLTISISLFIYEYGISKILENGIYIGALSVLIIYIITGKFWRKLFSERIPLQE